MKTTRLLVLIALALPLSQVVAQDESWATIAEVDTSKWKCKYCEVEEGWSGDIMPGFGYVSDDSFKFGEYTGLNEQGTYLIADANLRYRNEDAAYLDLSASDLGLDSRSLSVEGGRQGSYELFLTYDELPHFISDSGSSPYLGIGSDSLTLPSTWVAAGSTGGMTGLATSLQKVDLETQRKQLGAGVTFTTDSPWSYTVKFRHDTKQGTRLAAGSFFLNSAQLVEPVDYVTDEIDASISYSAHKWQANFAYFASTFSNSNKSLTWQNAYTPLTAGADSGELALPPDNQFHQFMLSAGYEISDRSRVSGDIAFGRMEQNEALLAATQNTTLVVPPLPTNSINAEVDTTNAKLKYTSMPTDRLRLSATYSYSDRDNNTPQLVYDWVITDSLLATQHTNQPYSFTRNLFKFNADYKYTKNTRFKAGIDLDTKQRTFQEIDKTNENTLWGRLRVRNVDNMNLEFKLAHSERSASSYEAVSAIVPAQNILMRKYNMADRNRDTVGIYANLTTESEYNIGLNLDFSTEDYDKSVLGLIDSRNLSIGGDIATMLSEETSLILFVGHEQIKSSQAGSQTFSVADWLASNDDSFNNIGIGVTHVVIKDRLDIGADYTKSRSSGRITVSGGGSDPAFPGLRTDLDIFKIYANYHIDETLNLRMVYWHENYDSSDWALDGVSSDTVSNLLSLGELNPSYSNDVIKLSMRYQF